MLYKLLLLQYTLRESIDSKLCRYIFRAYLFKIIRLKFCRIKYSSCMRYMLHFPAIIVKNYRIIRKIKIAYLEILLRKLR